MTDLPKVRKFSFLRMVVSGGFLAICVLLFGIGKIVPGFVGNIYAPFSRFIVSKLAFLLSFAPISFAEFLILFYVGFFLTTLVLCIVKTITTEAGPHHLLRWVSYLMLTLSIAVFVFVTFWGLNYSVPSIGKSLDLQVKERSAKTLEATAYWLLEMANDTSYEADRTGGIVVAGGFFGLRDDAPEGFSALADANPLFEGYVALPKRVTFWPVLSYTGISGIFFPITGEANVNPSGPDSTLPFTMCHELAHSLGFAQEDEANFIAFLACEQNSNGNFRYSGALTSFIYVYNAVAAENPMLQHQLYTALNEEVLADMNVLSTYYKKYEGPAQDIGDAINDTYLKTMGQTEGTKTYGGVTDLLIAEYVKRHGDPG